MKKKKISIMLVTVFMLLLGVLSACGKEEASTTEKKAIATDLPDLPKEIKDRGKFVVAVKVDYPPLGYLDEDGKNVGYEIDLVKKMAEYAFGSEDAVEYVPVNATNRIPFLQSKKVDFISATLGITEERKKEVDFTSSTFYAGAVTVVPKGSDIKQVSDLAGKKVIVIKGSTASIYLDENIPTAKQIKIENNSDAFRALKDGRADAILHDAVLMSEFIKTNKDYVMVGDQVAASHMAQGVRKGDDELLAFLNASLEKMKKEDYYQTLVEKYMPSMADATSDGLIPRP